MNRYFIKSILVDSSGQYPVVLVFSTKTPDEVNPETPIIHFFTNM